jgi:formylglycine-generating enzyme required for sulfatase activity
MEYLFVKRLVENDSACLGADLTDQMSAFLVPQNSVDIEFVWIPPGKFEMGSSEGDEAERPVHTVQIRQGFLLGKYQVTQAQWEQVMGDNPSHFKGAEHPVDSVSWNDAQKFIQKLNTLEGRNAYRLPSEAEWEYAARAESTAAYCFGDDVKQLRDYAWYDENSENKTHPVGQLKPNARGVYDMHGNVWEWVQDWYAVDYYQ